jgi:hypothetical protein
MDKERRGKRREEKRENKEKGKKGKKKKANFRHFIISIQQVKLFCQMFSKMTSAPSEKPLHRRSQSRSRFWSS